MTKRPKSDEELLASFDASLARDVLTDMYSDQQVEESLRAAGGDAAAIGRRGAELAAKLLEKRRLAWQERARKKNERAQVHLGLVTDYSSLGKPEILALLHQARNKPHLSGPVSQLFHKRKPEDTSLDELREILIEVDALSLIDGASDDKDDT